MPMAFFAERVATRSVEGFFFAVRRASPVEFPLGKFFLSSTCLFQTRQASYVSGALVLTRVHFFLATFGLL